MRIVTEMQLKTSDGLDVELNSLGSQYVVVYNPWTDGAMLRDHEEVPLSELRNAIGCGEVHSILLSNLIHESDEDDFDIFLEEEESHDILIMASSITSVVANDVSVLCE